MTEWQLKVLEHRLHVIQTLTGIIKALESDTVRDMALRDFVKEEITKHIEKLSL